jgi:hypothetical protein
VTTRYGLKAVAGPDASPPRRARRLRAAGAPSGATPDGPSCPTAAGLVGRPGGGTRVDGDLRRAPANSPTYGHLVRLMMGTDITIQGRRERTGAGAPSCRRTGRRGDVDVDSRGVKKKGYFQIVRSRPVAKTHKPTTAAAFNTMNVHESRVGEPNFDLPKDVKLRIPSA